MPGPNSTQLRDLSRLLREGRPTEADRVLDAMARELDADEQAAKLVAEAKDPKTEQELELAFKQQLCAILGNHPKLTAILVELEGFAAPKA
jgi:hypothetical protein